MAMRGIPLDLGLAPKAVLNCWMLRSILSAVFVPPVVYGMLATACRREGFVRCVLRLNCTEADELNRTTPTRVLSDPMSEFLTTLETKFRTKLKLEDPILPEASRTKIRSIPL